MIHQDLQDRMWRFYQNNTEMGRFSTARQIFMGRQCRPKQTVLNIGIGDGVLEELLVSKSVDLYSF